VLFRARAKLTGRAFGPRAQMDERMAEIRRQMGADFQTAPQKESDGPVIELTYNWDEKEYELGNAFGHIAIEVDDVYLACDAIREKGGDIMREAGPMKGSRSILAFVKDPDGYMVELLSPR